MGTTAEVLAVYGKDYYKGAPVITKNTYGAGTAYHIAANCEDALIEELCKQLVVDAQITVILGDVDIPDGIGICYRENETKRYIFIGNFSDEAKCVAFSKSSENEEKKYVNILDDEEIFGEVCLEPYGIVILEERVEKVSYC